MKWTSGVFQATLRNPYLPPTHPSLPPPPCLYCLLPGDWVGSISQEGGGREGLGGAYLGASQPANQPTSQPASQAARQLTGQAAVSQPAGQRSLDAVQYNFRTLFRDIFGDIWMSFATSERRVTGRPVEMRKSSTKLLLVNLDS